MNKRVKVIIPFPFDEKGIANRRAQLPNEFIRPGFEVEFVPVQNSCAYGDSYYDTLLMDMFIFEADSVQNKKAMPRSVLILLVILDCTHCGRASRFRYLVLVRLPFISRECLGISSLSLRCGTNGSICTKKL